MMNHVVLVGVDGFELCLQSTGYESPDIAVGADADWLNGSVSLRVGSSLIAKAESEISWRTEELEVFSQALEQLLAGEREDARLDHLEERVDLALMNRGAGFYASGTVTDHLHLTIAFKDIRLDRVDIERACQELKELVDAFPVRSSLSAEG